MMIYKKTFSENKVKSESDLKRQCYRALNKGVPAKSSHNTRKKTNHLDNNPLSARYVLVLLFIIAISLMAIYYKSILIYWQQTYHTDLFDSGKIFVQDNLVEEQVGATQKHLIKFKALPIVDMGNFAFPKESLPSFLKSKLLSHEAIQIAVTAPDQSEKRNNQEKTKVVVYPDLPRVKNYIEHNERVLPLSLGERSEVDQVENSKNLVTLPIVLSKNDKVFLAGDSLMQGVAPYVKKMLFKEYSIESLDLSKQSTGLAYPKAFNWPHTINEYLAADPSIKLLIIFLGPNDPWDFPVKGYTKYAKFKSELWEEHYRLRIGTIFESAKKHNVQVLWLAPPCMRKSKLNDGMIYLSSLYESEVEKARQYFLKTNMLLGCTYQEFSSFIETGKEKIKVRSDDGIHFTSTGQKILAKAIIKLITFSELEGSHID